MSEPAAEPADAPEPRRRPSLLVFVDIPGAGGEGLTLGLPAAVTPRRVGPPLPEVLRGGGGIDPQDMQELRDAVQTLRMKGVRMLRGAFPLTLATFLPDAIGTRAVRY